VTASGIAQGVSLAHGARLARGAAWRPGRPGRK
jgi:hypothetical protein